VFTFLFNNAIVMMDLYELTPKLPSPQTKEVGMIAVAILVLILIIAALAYVAPYIMLVVLGIVVLMAFVLMIEHDDNKRERNNEDP